MKNTNKYILTTMLAFIAHIVSAQGPELVATDACGANASQGAIAVDLSEMNNYPYTFSVEQQQADGEFEEIDDLQQEITTGTDYFSIDDLEAGNYRISAIDACGCKWGGLSMLHAGLNYNDCLVTIEENCCSWTIESSSTNASCTENIGSISLNILGGSGNFNIEWLGYPELEGLQSLTNLSSGTYIANVTDLDWLCTETLTFTINKMTSGIAAQNDIFHAKSVQYENNSFTAQSRVKVDISGDRKISASLYTLSGMPVRSILNNELLSEGSHIFDVDVSDLNDGLYILVGEVNCPDNSGGKIDTDLGVKH